MADVTINDLAVGSVPVGADIMEVEQGGASAQITVDQLAQSAAFSGRYGSGSTNLSYDAASATVQSDTGTDAVLTEAVSGGNSGLMSGADKAKLVGIEDGATADQSDGEIVTAYNNQVAIATTVEAQAGVSTAVRRWTPARIAEAVTALAPGGGGGVTSVDGLTGAVDLSGVYLAATAFPVQFGVTLSDNGVEPSAGLAKTIRAPHDFTLNEVRASLATAGTTNTVVDIHINGVSVLTPPQNITIDSGTKTSLAAATQPLVGASVLDDQVIEFYVDSVGTGSDGLVVYMMGTAVVGNVQTVPSIPTAFQVTGEDTFVTVDWNVPASEGGSSITDYEIDWRESGALWLSESSSPISTGITAPPFTYDVTGLSNGVVHNFRMRAVNSGGAGNWTATLNATPAGTGSVPSKPLINVNAQNGQVACTWNPPADGGSPITSYTVEYKRNDEPSVWTARTPVATTNDTVTGLTNGVTYDFRMYATNAIGNSDYSDPKSATPTNPQPPTVTAVILANRIAGDNSTEFRAVAIASNNGSAFTSSEWEFSTASQTGPWNPLPWGTLDYLPGTDLATTTIEFGGATPNTTYYARCRYQNAVGWSNWSAGSAGHPTAP